MPAGQETISLRWQAELGDLRRQMAEIPGITEKEAREMARALDRQMQAAGKSAEKAAKSSKIGWKDLKSTLTVVAGAAAAAAAAFTGAAATVARLTKEVVDARNALGDAALRTGLTAETLQALQQAAQGSGQEIDALFVGAQRIPKLMADVENGLVTAQRAFKRLGVETHSADGTMRDADGVLRDVITSLGHISSDTERAAAAMELFGRQGGAMAQALSGGVEQFDALVRFTERWGVSSAPEAIAQAGRMQQEIAAVGTVWRGAKDRLLDYIVQSSSLEVVAGTIVGYSAALREFVGSLGDEIHRVASAFAALADVRSPRQAAEALLEIDRALNVGGNVAMDFVDAMIAGREATQEFRDDWAALMKSLQTTTRVPDIGGDLGTGVGDAVDAEAKLLEKIAAIRKASTADLLSDEDRIRNRMFERLDVLVAIRDEAVEGSIVQIAASKAIVEAMDSEEREQHAHRLAMERELEELKQRHREAAEAANAQRLAEIEAQHQASVSAAADLFGSVAALAEKTAERQGDANAEAGARWFRWYQGLAIIQSVINGAAAAGKAIADYGLPWGIPVAAAAVAAVAVETATIASQSPPTYHSGGLAYEAPMLAPDEGTSIVRTGEGVLTERGLGAVGGPEGLAAANRGEAPAQTIVVSMVYKHRIFGEIVRDSMRLPGSPLRSAIKGGSRVGHRRS